MCVNPVFSAVTDTEHPGKVCPDPLTTGKIKRAEPYPAVDYVQICRDLCRDSINCQAVSLEVLELDWLSYRRCRFSKWLVTFMQKLVFYFYMQNLASKLKLYSEIGFLKKCS